MTKKDEKKFSSRLSGNELRKPPKKAPFNELYERKPVIPVSIFYEY